MKNIITLLSLILLLSTNLIAQQLFKTFEIDESIYDHMIYSLSDIDTSEIKDQMLFLDINWSLVERVMQDDPQTIKVDFPFFDTLNMSLELDQFSVYSDELNVVRYTSGGEVFEKYNPRIKTYRINSIENNLRGVFIFSNMGFKGVFSIDNQTYQVDKFKTENYRLDSIYFLSNINHSPIDFDFSCAHDDLNYEHEVSHENRIDGNNFGCVELAIEIDYYTFQTFSSYENSIDWALEMISVVSEVFLAEIEIGIVSNSAQIWETNDPYSNFINEPQNMLVSVRENWLNNEFLSSVDRDLVHLFSKRDNTGTGGIAFLNGIGSTWNGYGLSSNLIDVDDYTNLPAPYFFWNIYCLAHELGHNFGAKHTQWCGWPGGPIDNCVDLEAILPGECEEYNNSPAPQIGTIMSYCHIWSFDAGGGILMKFHDNVKTAIIAYAGLQNLNSCDNDIVFGCIDSIACNYDLLATDDDGSCLYPEVGYDCFGDCIDDENQDGICDDENLILSNNINDNILLYPNPANDYIQLRLNDFFNQLISLKIFNIVGQIVFNQSNLKHQSTIDVSSMPAGLYSAHIINDDKIIKQSFIIQ